MAITPEKKPRMGAKVEGSWCARAVAVALVLSFGVLAGLYSIVTPMWEAPDETGHFGFIQQLLTTRRLPEQQVGVLGQSHQPPLYYIIASIVASPADLDQPTGAFRHNPNFAWAGGDVNISRHHTEETFPFRGQALAFHLARGASVLMGMVTVALTIAIGWRIFPDRLWIGLLAGALVAFNPQFLFISGSINNDALLTMTTTGILWQATRMIVDKGRPIQWLALGLWISAAFLAKSSSVIVAGVAITFLALEYMWPQSRQRTHKQLLQGMLLAIGVVILLSGWWFARNQILYGDPLGWSAYQEIYAVNLRDSPLTWDDIRRYVTIQFRSFWGVFGWIILPAPAWFYTIIIILISASLSGYVLLFVSGRLGRQRGANRLTVPLMATAVVAQEIYQTWAITINNDSWYQGRYLFPVIAPAGLLLAIGLTALLWLLPKRSRLWALGSLMIILAGLATFMLLGVIAPAFETATMPKSSLWFIPNRTNVAFGDMINLRGYEIKSDQNNSSISLTLYWQAVEKPDFQYSAFVHLVNDSGRLVAQDDGPPGEDQDYPPLSWLPEDIVRDERVIELPENVRESLTFYVWLYNWTEGRRLPAKSTGTIVDDATVFSFVNE
jgi:4-amino-4-deoxy-L-arabinose transferase-like glycosyltransferase